MNVSQDIVTKVQSAFNFTVDKYPLAGPDGMRTPWYGLFRSDNAEVVGSGSVTSRYLPHTTDDVLALVEAASVAFDGAADVRCHFRDGHYVAVTPSKDYRRAVYGSNDNIFPRLVIDAGYGGRPFVSSLGIFRDACQNLMILRTVKAATVSIRHTSGLRPKMDELIETFSGLKEGWATVASIVEGMENRRVNMVEFLNSVYGEPGDGPRATTMHRNRTEAIFRRLHTERMRTGRPSLNADWNVSAWEAFNVVQGYVQHEARRHGTVTPMDRVMMAATDPAVLRAETVALTV
jgi:hypothetical protein